MVQSREGGGSLVLELLVRSGLFNFQLLIGGGTSYKYFITGKWHTFAK